MAKVNARTDSELLTSSETPFNVVIPNGELAQIREWVLQYPTTETGGDLFGLWSKGNTAVVQLVLGPGRNNRRSAVSYFQDTKYLAKAGSILTQQYGLCHMGEWHSHHTLGLAQPSNEDQKTVCSNMPNNGSSVLSFHCKLGQGDTKQYILHNAKFSCRSGLLSI